MIRKLEIIFGVDPIACKLRVARHVAIFFQQLRRIAARAAVNPVAVVTAATIIAVLAPIVPAAIAATGSAWPMPSSMPR